MSPVKIKEYLINKVLVMLRKKGRLVAPRNTKKMSEEQKKLRAISRAKQKLGGEDKWNKIKLQYSKLRETKPVNHESLADGLIMSLIQRNLSNNEIFLEIL